MDPYDQYGEMSAQMGQMGMGDGMGGGDCFGMVHPPLYNAESRRLKRSESPGAFAAVPIQIIGSQCIEVPRAGGGWWVVSDGWWVVA